MYTYFSRGGRYRVTALNDDGRTVIKLYDARTNAPVKLPNLPAGDITSVSISKTTIAWPST